MTQLALLPGYAPHVADSDCWQTPDDFLEIVRRVAPIALDPCTVRSNPTEAEFIRTPECDPDGLETEWHSFGGMCFVNPPYSDPMPWVQKVIEEADQGAEIVALMPVDTSTRWARALLRSARLVCFPSRIRFRGATGSPNFWNAVYYFGQRPTAFHGAFGHWPIAELTP